MTNLKNIMKTLIFTLINSLSHLFIQSNLKSIVLISGKNVIYLESNIINEYADLSNHNINIFIPLSTFPYIITKTKSNHAFVFF